MNGHATYIPLNEILTWWPEHLFGDPGLQNVGITGYSLVQSAARATAHIDLAVGNDIVIAVAGVEGFEFVLPTTDLAIEAEYSGDFELRAGGFGAALRITSSLIVPVDGAFPDWSPRLDEHGVPEAIELSLDVGQIVLDADFSPTFDFSNELSLSPFMIGNTGIVVEVSAIRFFLSGKEIPPPGQPEGFRGLALEQANIYLPASFDLPGVTPDNISVRGLVIGQGGVSGSFSGEWQLGWEGLTPTGSGAGTLLGLPFGLKSLAVDLVQNALSSTGFAGEIGIPFFDAVMGVDITLDMDGNFALALSQMDEEGLVELTIPFLGTFTLAGLGVVSDEAGVALLLSGILQLDVLSPALQWPAIELQQLRIAPGGEVELPDGWIDLPEPVALDLYGFRLEITRIGFGNTDDGRRWVGFSGGVQLLPSLPTGASVEGLRIIWDPTGVRDVEVTLQGVGVELTLPGVLTFAGDVAFVNEEVERYFKGNASLAILPLGIKLDASVKIGRNLVEDYKYIYTFMGLTLPVGLPIWATGAALYGISGLYGMNVNPSAQDGDWYAWYAGPPQQFNVTNADKWIGKADGKALGAGMTLGTLFDLGRVVSAKALFALVMPGPVIILHGMANLLQTPPDPDDASSEGVFNMLAVLDALAGSLQLNLDAGWSLSQVIDITAAAETYFDFADLRNWHVYLGQDKPEERRIRADFINLFHADAYLMIDSDGIATGASISYGYDWKFGPVKVILRAWAGADAAISWQPPQLEGSLNLGGEFEISVAGFGIGLSAEAILSGKTPTLYWVRGELLLRVKLPTPIKDLEEDIVLEWREEATPNSEDPFKAISLDHPKVDETWVDLLDSEQTASPGTSDYVAGPIVPLDARPAIVFDRGMKDATGGGQFTTSGAYPGGTKIGEHTFDYELLEVVLEKWSKAGGYGWQAVDELYGVWSAVEDGGGDPANTRLQLWAKSPFAFTRQTSRTYRDAFLQNQLVWPCADVPDYTIYCVDWEDAEVNKLYGPFFEYSGLFFTLVFSDYVEVVNADLVDCGTSKGLRIEDGLKFLWIVFPEPVHTVEICIDGDYTAVSVYANGERVDQILDPEPGTVAFQTPGVDTLLLWASDNAVLSRICYLTEAEASAYEAAYDHNLTVYNGLKQWESEDEILEPETYYRLTVRQETVRTYNGSSTRVPFSHYAYFQTAGPPGLTPAWALDVNGGAEDEVDQPYPLGGKLTDLKEYITWTIPGDGAQPVYRGYDLGADFNENCVEQMYGADMAVRLLDANEKPVLDEEGNEVQFPNQWAEQPIAELSETEFPYTTRVEDCLSLPGVGYVGDQKILFANGVLLEEDFMGDLEQWIDPHTASGGEWTIQEGRLLYDNTIIPPLGALLVAGDSEWADYAVEVSLSDQGADVGLACRYSNEDAEMYYRLRLNALGRYLEKVIDGAITVLWQDSVAYVPGDHKTLAIQCDGGKLRGQLDGELLFEVEDNTCPSGQVGIFTNSTATFEHFLVRVWPGSDLQPQTLYRADLLASFVLFRGGLGGGWIDSAYNWVQMTNTNRRIAALGREEWDDYRVEVNMTNTGPHMGIIARFQQHNDGTFTCYRLHINQDDELVVLARLEGIYSGSTYQLDEAGRTELWSCSGEACGVDFLQTTHSVALACEDETLVVEVDGHELIRVHDPGGLSSGKAGLYYVGADDPDFSELVVRSAPRQAVRRWHFVSSRFAGFVEHMDTFNGHVYPEIVSGVDEVQLADLVANAEAEMTTADQAVAAGRALLAGAGPDEITARRIELQETLAEWASMSATHFEAIYDRLLGGAYRPLPPAVELSEIVQEGQRLALLLESPEPIDLARLSLYPGVRNLSTGAYDEITGVFTIWSDDGTRALQLSSSGAFRAAGDYVLLLTYELDIGLEAPLLRRGGSVLPEVAALQFELA